MEVAYCKFKFLFRKVYINEAFVTMRSKKGQAVSSFLGDKLTTSFVHGSSEISTVRERSHIVAISRFPVLLAIISQLHLCTAH